MEDVEHAGAAGGTAPDEGFGDRLRAVAGSLARAAMRAGQASSIPVEVLGMLERSGPMTAAELAGMRQVRPQTMATTVKELTGAGLVVGSAHPVDGRKTVLELTPAGRRALREDRAQRAARIAAAGEASLEPAERQLLADAIPVLEKLVTAMGRV